MCLCFFHGWLDFCRWFESMRWIQLLKTWRFWTFPFYTWAYQIHMPFYYITFVQAKVFDQASNESIFLMFPHKLVRQFFHTKPTVNTDCRLKTNNVLVRVKVAKDGVATWTVVKPQVTMFIDTSACFYQLFLHVYCKPMIKNIPHPSSQLSRTKPLILACWRLKLNFHLFPSIFTNCQYAATFFVVLLCYFACGSKHPNILLFLACMSLKTWLGFGWRFCKSLWNPSSFTCFISALT